MKFSIIIPLYNRPQEIDELLDSLTRQRYTDFEVIVVEDGSTKDAAAVMEKYRGKLNLFYYQKQNEGQGFTRNFAFARATGDYFICFDSDCLIPENYLEVVHRRLETDWLDAYGGPDAAHPSFTPVQKAISYSMTSLFTTGGIRGKEKNAGGTFHPRSFNMGISRKVWEATGGYVITRMAEDIEFSIRIHALDFRIGLIPEAIVYHKRRTSFFQFWKQLHFFGRGRINLSKQFGQKLKIVHFFPAAFTTFVGLTVVLNLTRSSMAPFCNVVLGLYVLLVFFDALRQTFSPRVAFLSVAAAFVQLLAYGFGFVQEGWKNLFLRQN
ncbi:MAG: glycosyltransferase [Mucilaginibacter polytrichastri]|nr:glycosyltransferase [Mucilaginibacter polytrichastri]